MVIERYFEQTTKKRVSPGSQWFQVDRGRYGLHGIPCRIKNHGWGSVADFARDARRRHNFIMRWDNRFYFNEGSTYGIRSFMTVHFEECVRMPKPTGGTQ